MSIGVIGSINVDLVTHVSRIPVKGETIIGDSISELPGGKGANQAVAISRLGEIVTMFGCIGDDKYGKLMVDNLKNENVNTDYIKNIKNVSTGMAIIMVDKNDNSIVVIPGANNYVDKNYIDSVKNEIFKQKLIIMQNEIPSDTVNYVVDLCYEQGIKVILNPAPARKLSQSIIDKLSYITPNEHEARFIFGNKDLEEILMTHPNKFIITEGEKGVRYSDIDGKIFHIPARKSRIVDTTGAGDTFNGALCVYLLQGRPLFEAIKLANITAGISTEKFGAQSGMPYLQQVLTEVIN